jgi:tRNA 5-methylaminomethyl-2-thiouridine biosynthesis bifunctional protein
VYDVAVVGCGIAGVTAAYQAKLEGLSTVIIEKDDPTCNASSAAGAFLSPKFGPKSSYSSLVNRAFNYSVDFYKKNFDEFLHVCGMLRLARDKEEEAKCDSYVEDSDFWIKKDGGYWCENAATISTFETIKKMASFADNYYKSEAKDFYYQDDCWNIGDIKAKHLILASGARLLLNEPYLYVKSIFGQRLEACVEKGFDFSVHRKCSIGPFIEGKVQIGASHIPSWRYQDSETLFGEYRDRLIQEAQDILQSKIAVNAEYRGFRSSTIDFFPYCGQVINAKETLAKIPHLIYGAAADEKEFIYHKNLWLHQGHGARGFVLAPYTAMHLIRQILNKKSDENEIKLVRAFIRYARKAKSKLREFA